MTQEEIKALLADDDFKAGLKELGYESAEDVEGLKRKRDELLGKTKALLEKTREYEEKYSGINLEEIEELKAKANQAKGNQNERELLKMKEQLEKLANEKSLIEGEYNKTLIRDSFKTAMAEANIDPIHYSVLTSAYMGKARIETDGNNRQIVIDDGALGASPSEFFKSYAAGEGKAYVAKPVNSGAGSAPLGVNRGVFTREDLKTKEGRKAYLESESAKIN